MFRAGSHKCGVVMDSSFADESAGKALLCRVPLAPVALAVAAGVCLGRYAPFATGFWVVIGILGLLGAVVSFLRPHRSLVTTLAALVGIVAAGAVHVRLTYFAAAPDDLVTYCPSGRILATVRGRIVTTPEVFEDNPAPAWGYSRPARTRFVVRARELRTRAGWQRVSGLAAVTVNQPDERLAAGQQVELVGWLGRVRPPSNPGQYDWSAEARKRQTLVSFSVPGVDGVEIARGGRQSWYERAFWRFRSAARQHLSTCADAHGASLLNALIIGERQPILRRLNMAMAEAGVGHFLSISGLHLGVFLGTVYLLCRLMAVRPARAAAVVLVVLAAYIVLAEPRPPLLRSAIMAAWICAAVILRKRPATLNALSGAALVLLILDPLQLFQVGFQLSFTIVGGLILLYRPVRSLLFGRWTRRRGLVVFRGDQRIARWLNYTVANRLMDAVAISLTAFLVSGPLVVYHFGRISPYAPVLNLLFFPLVVAVLVPGYLSLGLAWPLPNLSHAIGRVAGAAADFLGEVAESMHALPGLSLELRQVSLLWVGLCYAAIGLILLTPRTRLGRVLAAVALLGVALTTAHSQRLARPPTSACLDLLAVGSGQCAILSTPSGGVYVIDAGTRGGFDAYSQVIAPFLRRRRLPAPHTLFISHANTDHYNAVPGLARGGHLKKAYLNSYLGRPPEGSAEFEADRELLAMLVRERVQIARLRAGDVVCLDERTSIEVLWPESDRQDLSANDTSLVLRVRCDGRSVLLPGDLGRVGQEALLAGERSLAADVLVLPHHGSWKAALPAFVEAVSPQIVLVSSSRDPTGRSAAPAEVGEFYTRLKTAYEYYSTAANGWVRVRLCPGRPSVTTMR